MSSLGERLGDLRRRRGLTQEQLAEASGLAVGTLRKLEQGVRDGARLATLHALARALDVPTSEIVDREQSTPEPVTEAQELNLMGLRTALAPTPRAFGGAAEAAADTATSIGAAWQMYHANAYSAVAVELPSLLTATRRGGDPAGLLSVLELAGRLLTQFDQTDLAYSALVEALELAESAGDTLTLGTLTNSLGWVFTRQGRLDDTRRVATVMADRIEPRLSKATPAELSVWGWLLLRASSAAVRDNRPGEADEMLSLASAAARRVPGGTETRGARYAFSSKLVAMKRAENAVVTDQPAKARHLVQRIPEHGHVPPSDYNRHRLDVASAYVSGSEYAQATDVLQQLRRDVPEWLRHQRLGRDVLSRALACRVRPIGTDMRELADFLHLD